MAAATKARIFYSSYLFNKVGYDQNRPVFCISNHMKLTKTTKKLDDNVCKALTIACDDSLHVIEGFAWLTHRANYTNFPASLIVTCVFETEVDIQKIQNTDQANEFRKSIQKQLLKVGVIIKNINKNIHFDSEEACNIYHQGLWSERLKISTSKQKPKKAKPSFH